MEKVLVITSSIVYFKIIDRMLQGEYEVSLIQEYDEEKVSQNDIIIIDESLFGKEMLPSDKKFIVVYTNITVDDIKYLSQYGGTYIVKPFLKETLMKKLLNY